MILIYDILLHNYDIRTKNNGMYICDSCECGHVTFLIEYIDVFVYLLLDGAKQKSS